MCGICGIINFDGRPVEDNTIRKMMAAMKHRGPDDEDVHTSGPLGIGHVRLSILDLSELGRQPMFSSDGRVAIVFNGEVYNYIELRTELIALGHSFKTATDTEVILAAYQQWGKDCQHRFNGMWALAILDLEKKEVFISRDRFGIKPLYYYKDEHTFIFASDIPPILAAFGKAKQPNHSILYDYLLYNRTNHSNETFFENVLKLQHGHDITVSPQRFKSSRWYVLADEIGDPFKSPDELADLLTSSVNLRMRSDVPVGVCLSGGLDSSTVVSTLLKRLKNPDFQTFSAIYEAGQKGDESGFINLYKDQVKEMRFTQPTADSLFQDLPDFVKALVEPVPNTSEYAEYKVMQLAQKHCTVILNGQGADEEMAGYLYFFGFYFKELFKSLRWLKLLSAMKHYRHSNVSSTGLKSFVYFMLPPQIRSRILFSRMRGLNSDFVSKHEASDLITKKLYGSPDLMTSLYNHFEYKFEHHLIWADKSGMHFSLESRFPFLDHRIVQRALALSPADILDKGRTKSILRDAMKDILPQPIFDRKDKVGYQTPQESWFGKKPFQELIGDTIESSAFRNLGFFDQDDCRQQFAAFLKDNQHPASANIWKWINVSMWHDQFIKN